MSNEINKDFNTLGEILAQSFEGVSEFSRMCKTIVLFSFWANIVGKKFENKSKPYSFKGGKLYVVCENAFVVQELSFNKKYIQDKLNLWASELGFKIEDMVLSYKNWHDFIIKEEEPEQYEDFFDGETLNNVQIDENFLKDVKGNISKLSFLNSEQKEKYFKDIQNSFKARKIRSTLTY